MNAFLVERKPAATRAHGAQIKGQPWTHEVDGYTGAVSVRDLSEQLRPRRPQVDLHVDEPRPHARARRGQPRDGRHIVVGGPRAERAGIVVSP